MRFAYLFTAIILLTFAGCIGWAFYSYMDDDRPDSTLDEFEERERQFQQDQHTDYRE